ncbi:MAG: hypothetical protein ABEI27_05555 [Halobellus sp.]|uniref:DUF7511 domain-containing protein n=1 Tax=Halobellus sp. TaxID=1979212 RepID=UPI0035D4838A
MSDASRNPGNRASTARDERDAAAGDRRFELRSVVVRYEHQPDRCTVYPRRESCCDRMEAWLVADVDAFVSLDELR